jgi:hypothetical protein
MVLILALTLLTIAKYLSKVTGSWGTVDSVTFWSFVTAVITFIIALIAWRQLTKINATTKG